MSIKSINSWLILIKILKISCSEGEAANVTVTIAALSGKDAIFKIAKIYTPNAEAAGLTAYVPSTKFTTIEPNNIALIKLATELPAAKFGAGSKFIL